MQIKENTSIQEKLVWGLAGMRNLRFGVFAFAEIFSFDIFLAETLEKVVVSVLFYLTSVIVVNFGKF